MRKSQDISSGPTSITFRKHISLATPKSMKYQQIIGVAKNMYSRNEILEQPKKNNINNDT